MYMEHAPVSQIVPVALSLSQIARRSPAAPLELRQIRRTLPCGVDILTVAIQAKHRDFTYALLCLPGFEGGGRDAEGYCLPRSATDLFTPKAMNPESGRYENVWPALTPTLRLINGREFEGHQFPETQLTRRIERAWNRAEPLIRQLCNLMQSKLVQDATPVNYSVLVERIKLILADV